MVQRKVVQWAGHWVYHLVVRKVASMDPLKAVPLDVMKAEQWVAPKEEQTAEKLALRRGVRRDRHWAAPKAAMMVAQRVE